MYRINGEKKGRINLFPNNKAPSYQVQTRLFESTKQPSSALNDTNVPVMPSKKKKYNARFPAGRIKKIMQMDDDVGKIAHAVPVLISRSVELFINSLLSHTAYITREKNAKTLSLSHTKHCIINEKKFDFLKDLVKNIADVGPEEDKRPLKTNPSSPVASYYDNESELNTEKGKKRTYSNSQDNDYSNSRTPSEANSVKKRCYSESESNNIENSDYSIQPFSPSCNINNPQNDKLSVLKSEDTGTKLSDTGTNSSCDLIIDEDYET